MKPSLGRIVHYQLTEQDASEINRRRVPGAGHGEGWPAGAQAHHGNPVHVGELVAAVVVCVFETCVNLRCLLDGTDTFWATSRAEGTVTGTWSWPERVE